MNIGEAVKKLQKDYPSVSISRLRFLEKEGLISPTRSKGGTRDFKDKDLKRILKILDLQENQFYTLKAIKNNPKLLTQSGKVNIVIQDYSFHLGVREFFLDDTIYGLKNYLETKAVHSPIFIIFLKYLLFLGEDLGRLVFLNLCISIVFLFFVCLKKIYKIKLSFLFLISNFVYTKNKINASFF